MGIRHQDGWQATDCELRESSSRPHAPRPDRLRRTRAPSARGTAPRARGRRPRAPPHRELGLTSRTGDDQHRMSPRSTNAGRRRPRPDQMEGALAPAGRPSTVRRSGSKPQDRPTSQRVRTMGGHRQDRRPHRVPDRSLDARTAEIRQRASSNASRRTSPIGPAIGSPGRGPRSARGARSGCAHGGRRTSAGRSRSRPSRPRRRLPGTDGAHGQHRSPGDQRRLHGAHRHLADERRGLDGVEAVSSGGDAVASWPSGDPMNRTCAPCSRADASASDNAGNTCPPVPPAAITTFTLRPTRRSSARAIDASTPTAPSVTINAVRRTRRTAAARR